MATDSETARHTKGPWKAIALGGASTVVAPALPGRNDTRAKVGYGYRDGEYSVGYPFLDDDNNVRMDFVLFSHEDAKLIAAAPDLLAMLKVAQLWLDVDGRFDMQGINAAIAKAEGRP